MSRPRPANCAKLNRLRLAVARTNFSSDDSAALSRFVHRWVLADPKFGTAKNLRDNQLAISLPQAADELSFLLSDLLRLD
jgi:hypothetical protein